MRKNYFLVCMLCFTFIGQALAADKPGFLPTKGIREGVNLEMTYDEHGHLISEKHNGKLVISREYHQLPNGKFVQILAETLSDIQSSRFSAAYDSNGMKLWEKYEYQEGENSWRIEDQTVAIVDGNGVRTGIQLLNSSGQLETVANVTFDKKGRITQLPLDSDEDGINDTYAIYTWGNGMNELLTASITGIYTFSNFVEVKNMEYFDAYSLYPLESDIDSYYNSTYAWEDYRLLEIFANIDVDMGGVEGNYVCNIDDANGKWTKTLTIGGMEMEKTVLELLVNGGWKEIYTSAIGSIESFEIIREYDEYGALKRYYNSENFPDEDYEYVYEESYERYYDAEGRPTKTIKRNGENVEYEETYTEWTKLGSSNVNPALENLTVYPNPAVDYIVIDNMEKSSTITIYNSTGQVVYKKNDAAGGTETISVASLAKGVYFVSILAENSKTVRKIIKK